MVCRRRTAPRPAASLLLGGVILLDVAHPRAQEAVPNGATDAETMAMAALAEVVSQGNETCRAVLSCCEGSGFTLSRQIWYAVRGWAEKWHVRELLDSTPRMLERYYTFYNLYDDMRRRKVAELWAHDCFFGVVSMFLNAVPATEFEEGLAAAQQMFLQAKAMLSQNNDTAAVNWTLPLEPLESTYPFYLGLRKTSCFGSRLKIYIYDTGVYSAGSVFCSAGQWGVEVMFHRFFAASDCRTDNPDEADLFLVPDYRACHYHLAPTYQHKGLTRLPGDDFHSQVIRNHAHKYRRWEDADVLFKGLVDGLEYFPRKRGLDHVFIFSDQGFIVNFTHTFPSWRDSIPHSIFMSTEAFTPGCGPSCFSPWKDLAIPGHIDWDRLLEIRKYNRPTSERDILFNFHGRLPANHEYYETNRVRGEILRLAELPNVSVGGFVEEYFEIMGSSHFCLVPEGTSSWTNHLYTSFFAGCIPLILSDNFVLPFQDIIDWPSVSVRWPQNAVGPELYVYVLELVTQRKSELEAMKRRVDEAACWFDFYAFDSQCSPYQAVLKDLEKRSRNLPAYLHPTSWRL
eukprot:TRINITY_DN3388_c0_g1_i1.p1 TRINITY_DN3388_c0_g1~~TRINITY_DN3388_c0_g1_i1.p1  ORF type:complete len:569 (-),score=112.01 TRINITY_DN3388_c0_g1_i1:582-2288(-)